MKITRDKKGAEHVETIISFVIFLSLIIFILVVFKPLTLFSKLGSSNLDITESEILKNISMELSVYSVKISAVDSEKDCFSIKNKTDDDRLIMRNESGEKINSGKQGDVINFEKNGDFYRIYLSEEFDVGSPPGCLGGIEEGEGKYTLGVLKTYDVVSNYSLNNLFKTYDENYPGLKEELGIKNEFNIVVRNKTSEILKTTKAYRPVGIEVMAKDIPIEILDKDGNLNPVTLNIQVWS